MTGPQSLKGKALPGTPSASHYSINMKRSVRITGYTALREQVVTPGGSLGHARLFPLYIKGTQACHTRFNKAQKPTPKPGLGQT
jgi:hypothetical protein